MTWPMAWNGAAMLATTFDVEIDLGAGLAGGALGAFLTTLVVGAILVALAPEYTDRKMASLIAEPLDSLLWGIFVLLALVISTVALLVTGIGIVVAVPLVLAAVVVWAVGAAIAYLAIAVRLVDREDGWAKPLVVAAGLNGALALTGIGGIVAFVVGAAGFGAVLRDWLE